MAPRRGKKSGGGRSSLKMDDDEMEDIDLIEHTNQPVSLDLQSSDDSVDSDEESDDDNADDNEEEGEENEEEEEEDHHDEDSDTASDDVDPETAWGRSSSQYYAGDTADLEIGQDFEEAKEEEAIAAKLQKKKRQAEEVSDYLLFDDNTGDKEDIENGIMGGDDDWENAKSLRDVSQLDDTARLKIILAESPELRGLLDQMKKYLDELSLLGLALDEAHMAQVCYVFLVAEVHYFTARFIFLSLLVHILYC
jgi:hypothetical protein